jgi:hypothetical protein
MAKPYGVIGGSTGSSGARRPRNLPSTIGSPQADRPHSTGQKEKVALPFRFMGNAKKRSENYIVKIREMGLHLVDLESVAQEAGDRETASEIKGLVNKIEKNYHETLRLNRVTRDVPETFRENVTKEHAKKIYGKYKSVLATHQKVEALVKGRYKVKPLPEKKEPSWSNAWAYISRAGKVVERLEFLSNSARGVGDLKQLNKVGGALVQIRGLHKNMKTEMEGPINQGFHGAKVGHDRIFELYSKFE